MSISSDEINYLIYRYLLENGFSHSAFSFSYESMVAKSSISHSLVPPGSLIALIQKGLEYLAIEEHINEDGTIREFENNFSLLSPIVCEALAQKEDRKLRRFASSNSLASAATTNNTSSASNPVPVPEANTEKQVVVATVNTSDIRPCSISLKQDAESNRWLLLTGHLGEVFMCMWNPSQRQLASGSADGMCRLWNLSEMNSEKWSSRESVLSLKTAILPHSQAPGERYKDVTSVTWSPDGKYLATGCYDGMARIWDNQGNLKAYLKEHNGPVFSLKWNKQGNYILSGSYDRRAIVWNAETGQVVKSFLLHSAPVLDVDWKDSETFATCSSDKNIYVCKVSSTENVAFKEFKGHIDEVNAVCWSPKGALLASCSDDSTAKIWSVESGLVFNLQGHSKEIYTVRWTPTGPDSSHPDKPLMLCTASFDGTVKVWNAQTGFMVHNLFNKQGQPVYSIASSPNGELLATGSLGGHVSVWSLKSGVLIREMKGSGDTFDVSWSHDGSMLCSCFSSGNLHVLDVAGNYDGSLGAAIDNQLRLEYQASLEANAAPTTTTTTTTTTTAGTATPTTASTSQDLENLENTADATTAIDQNIGMDIDEDGPSAVVEEPEKESENDQDHVMSVVEEDDDESPCSKANTEDSNIVESETVSHSMEDDNISTSSGSSTLLSCTSDSNVVHEDVVVNPTIPENALDKPSQDSSRLSEVDDNAAQDAAQKVLVLPNSRLESNVSPGNVNENENGNDNQSAGDNKEETVVDMEQEHQLSSDTKL